MSISEKQQQIVKLRKEVEMISADIRRVTSEIVSEVAPFKVGDRIVWDHGRKGQTRIGVVKHVSLWCRDVTSNRPFTADNFSYTVTSEKKKDAVPQQISYHKKPRLALSSSPNP